MNEKKFAVNPVMALFLGACPALALTTNVTAAMTVAVLVLALLLVSSLLMAILRPLLADSARIAVCVIIVAGLVCAAQMLLNAYLPNIYPMLGLYLAVIAVDLLVVCRGSEAGEKGFAAVIKALISGLIFAVVIIVMAAIREVFGSASFAGKDIAVLANYTIPALTKAPGGFIVLAICMAVVNAICPSQCSTSRAAALAEEKGE